MEDKEADILKAGTPIKYSGILGVPLKIDVTARGLLSDTLDANLIAKHEEIVIAELLKLFGIEADDPDCWKALAIRFAREHVPGMTIERIARSKPGPKSKWAGKVGSELIEAIHEKSGGPEGNIADAARQLIEGGGWKGRLNDAETAERRYHDAQRARRKSGPLDAPAQTKAAIPKKRRSRSSAPELKA